MYNGFVSNGSCFVLFHCVFYHAECNIGTKFAGVRCYFRESLTAELKKNNFLLFTLSFRFSFDTKFGLTNMAAGFVK